ncbi:MAG: hypothetical protein QM793_09115 [Muricomes sp.]
MEEKYHFTIKDFYEMAGTPVYCTQILNNRMLELEERCKRLEKQKEDIEKNLHRHREVIDELRNSTS